MVICTDCDLVLKEESTPVLMKKTMDDDNSHLILKNNNNYYVISEKILSILTHVFIMLCFVTYFFFAYVIDIERKLLLEKMDEYCDNLNSEYHNQNHKYRNDISKLYSRYYKKLEYIENNYERAKHDQNVLLHNLIIKAIFMISFVGIFFMISLLNAIWIKNYIHWKHIIIENILMFVFLGTFEYLFFTWIIMNYSPISDTELEYIVYTNVNKIINGTYT